MPTKLIVGVVTVAFDGCFLERAVYAFDLTVGPPVTWVGEQVFDRVLAQAYSKAYAKNCSPFSMARWVSAAAEQIFPSEVECVLSSLSTVWIV